MIDKPLWAFRHYRGGLAQIDRRAAAQRDDCVGADFAGQPAGRADRRLARIGRRIVEDRRRRHAAIAQDIADLPGQAGRRQAFVGDQQRPRDLQRFERFRQALDGAEIEETGVGVGQCRHCITGPAGCWPQPPSRQG